MKPVNDFRNLYFVRDWCGYKESFSFIRASSKCEIKQMVKDIIKKLYLEDQWEQEMEAIHIIEVKTVNMKTLRKNVNKWLKVDNKE